MIAISSGAFVNVAIVAIVVYLIGVLGAMVWLRPPDRDSEPRPKRGGTR